MCQKPMMVFNLWKTIFLLLVISNIIPINRLLKLTHKIPTINMCQSLDGRILKLIWLKQCHRPSPSHHQKNSTTFIFFPQIPGEITTDSWDRGWEVPVSLGDRRGCPRCMAVGMGGSLVGVTKTCAPTAPAEATEGELGTATMRGWSWWVSP